MRTRRLSLAASGVLTLLVTWGALGIRLSAQQPDDPPEPEAEVVTAPVVIDGGELFRVRGVSSYPAETRARTVQRRIVAVAEDRAVAVESLQSIDGEGVTRITAGDMPVMDVVDADADIEFVARPALAAAHLLRIQQAITRYREARTPEALRRAVISASLATALLILFVFGLRHYWRWVDRVLQERLRQRIRSVEIKSFELMRAEQIWNAVRSMLLALRTIVVAVVALMYLGFILALFPGTRGLSQNMTALVLEPLEVMGSAFAAHIPSLIFLVILFLIVRVGLKVARLFFDALGRGSLTIEGFDPEWALPTYKIARLAVVAFAIIVAYPYIPGSSTAAFHGVSLFVGIVFSLGSTAAISNIIAGYVMTYRRALKVGDRVKIGDATGDVIETRLQVTHLRSVKNEEIIIPNSQILAGEVINYSSLARTRGLILHTEVGIGYETPWRQVEAMLLLAAARTEGLSNDEPPFVLEKQLGDFAVTYELNAYCRNVGAMAALYAALHRNIMDVFNEYGVQIMTPAYESDPETPKLVEPKDWHLAPAVRPAVAGDRRREGGQDRRR